MSDALNRYLHYRAEALDLLQRLFAILDKYHCTKADVREESHILKHIEKCRNSTDGDYLLLYTFKEPQDCFTLSEKYLNDKEIALLVEMVEEDTLSIIERDLEKQIEKRLQNMGL